MLKTRPFFALALALVAIPLALHADVKTRQRTQMKFEGMMGRVMNMASGGAADGITNTIAVKGARKAEINDRTGRIVDLAEQKVYELDMRRKEYRVVTFAELKAQWEKAKADAEKAMKDAPQTDQDELAQSGKEVEISFDITETTETRSIAGHTARKVIVLGTVREKGKTIEEGGGMVLQSDYWVAPRIAALDEIAQFDMKFIQAVYGEDMAVAAQQMAQMFAMYPSLQKLQQQMQEKARALEGTTLAMTMKTETVRSAEALAQTPPPPSGGLGGALARRLGAGRKPEPRSVLMTSTTETQSIDTAATDADVAIPAGFKEKK
jgi:hypothetical protein